MWTICNHIISFVEKKENKIATNSILLNIAPIKLLFLKQWKLIINYIPTVWFLSRLLEIWHLNCCKFLKILLFKFDKSNSIQFLIDKKFFVWIKRIHITLFPNHKPFFSKIWDHRIFFYNRHQPYSIYYWFLLYS